MQVADIFALLNTNNGEYAAACALDFSKPPLYYDTFALRDWEGHEHVMQTWPYFRAEESRRALKDSRPVPVSSCWNGVGEFSARLLPYLSQSSDALQFLCRRPHLRERMHYASAAFLTALRSAISRARNAASSTRIILPQSKKGFISTRTFGSATADPRTTLSIPRGRG